MRNGLICRISILSSDISESWKSWKRFVFSPESCVRVVRDLYSVSDLNGNGFRWEWLVSVEDVRVLRSNFLFL